MTIHGSCAARDGAAVLVRGRPGSGKSDLVLRLIDRGFVLVADDQVEIEGVSARPPVALAGLLEVRGLGLVRMGFVAPATIRLVVMLDDAAPRLPEPMTDPALGVPMVRLEGRSASAAQVVALALDCVLGQARLAVGALT